MLGKRPRQIPRTTSMSQLARPPVFAEHAPLDRHAAPSGSATNPQLQYPNSAGVSQTVSMPSCGTQDQRVQLQVVESVMGEEAAGMNPEHDSLMQNGLLYTEGTPMMQQSLGVDALGQSSSMHGRPRNESFPLPPESGRWVPFMGSVPSYPVHAKSEAAASIRPVDFLEICFFCKRRLVHGQDIFMYMGDIASCSEECRNQLIVSDERRSTSASQNGSPRRDGRVVSSETAVAA